MNRGYVKVWRKIEDSGLIQLPNTLALFMHLLLNATHKERKVGTPTGVIELKRGQYISGRIELAARLKQTEQQIRTSLKRLEELQIITIEATNRFSVYTIENYSKYQDEQLADNQHDNQQITNKQPTDNQQITTKQELKHLNIKTFNKNITRTSALDDGFDEFYNAYPKKKNKTDAEKAWKKIKPPIDDVLIALAWQRESKEWQKESGKFIPYPASYLNAGGWMDEPIADDFVNEKRNKVVL